MRASFGLLVLFGTLCAQVPQDPILVKNLHTRSHRRGGTELAFSVVNNSGRPIAGFDVAVEIIKNGKTVGVFHGATVMGDGKPINPGNVLEMKGFVIHDKELPEHRVSVDYILFLDGKSWGPDKHRGSSKVAELLLHSQTQRTDVKK